MYLFGFVFFVLGCVNCLDLRDGAYEDLVVQIADTVPNEDCQTLVSNLKSAITDSSQYLFNALDGRAYIRTVQIVLPPSWSDACAQGPIGPSAGDKSDISIVATGPTGASTYTQQSNGCGKSGDQIYLRHDLIRNGDESLGRVLVKEFAKYRYGVFDEHGFDQDQVYPMCYRENEDEPLKVTGCSDMAVRDNGICTNTKMPYNVSDLVMENARSSIMFAAEAPSVNIFCDEFIHNRNAPTKHNFMCARRSTLDVILQSPDFLGNIPKDSKGITNTTPTFVVKRQTLTRYVMVIEDTKEMMIRDSWTYLRTAIRKWTVNDLPSNTEVGLVMTNETKATKVMDITSLTNPRDRDLVASNVPYTPGDTRAASCLKCALEDAIQMLKERTRTHGPASSVIILMAPGMEYGIIPEELIEDTRNSKIKIVTINYPGVSRGDMLDKLAEKTNGVAYTVLEKKQNIDSSLLTTYFQLTNVLYSITQQFYAGNPLDLPIEIHRRELYDDVRNSVTGSFVLDSDLGEPARFALYTHNVDAPLIKYLALWSPSQQLYQAKSETMSNMKIITIAANINETGTWTYKIERFSGNPQPHFIQVMATPRSSSASVVRARFWTGTNRPDGPLILFVEVKKQDRPVMGAKVEVTVTRPDYNGTGPYKEKFDLLDTGSGDPDVTKGDGIYTRYFSASNSGPGMYTFEVTVTDHGTTAYAVVEDEDYIDTDKPCCGSFIHKTRVQQLSSFQRVLPPINKFITYKDIQLANSIAIGRIGDLKTEIYPEEQKIKLIFTAPDMGGTNAARYEVKYAFSIRDITENFETTAKVWEYGSPFLQSSGSETTYTMNLTNEPSLLDRAVYLAVKAYGFDRTDAAQGPISNWVRVFVSKPKPPPTPPAVPQETIISWPENNHKSNDVIDMQPSTKSNYELLQIIITIVVGVILFAIIIFVICWCVMRKKNTDTDNSDKLAALTIVPPATPTNIQPSIAPPQHNTAYATDNTDHHTVGVPIYQDHYDDEPKKRLSIVHQQEQQLIEELREQQHRQNMQNNIYNGNLSITSNSTLQRGERTLSPYESWTASQLLHEHERRHSPIIDEMPQDHMSMNVPEHFSAPPVPPLPAYDGYSVNHGFYGIHQPHPRNQMPVMVQTIYHPPQNPPYNASLQGSMSSVNSGEKKKRNVTMV